MKTAILTAVKTNLNHIANKKLIDNGLVHAVLLDFLNQCNDEDKQELITAFSPFVPSLASTKDGVRAAIICFWNSVAKDRRVGFHQINISRSLIYQFNFQAILKTLKEHLIKLCTHEFGHILIIAIVNSMDDTKALKKSIFDPIFNEINTIVSNEWGRKIIGK